VRGQEGREREREREILKKEPGVRAGGRSECGDQQAVKKASYRKKEVN